MRSRHLALAFNAVLAGLAVLSLTWACTHAWRSSPDLMRRSAESLLFVDGEDPYRPPRHDVSAVGLVVFAPLVAPFGPQELRGAWLALNLVALGILCGASLRLWGRDWPPWAEGGVLPGRRREQAGAGRDRAGAVPPDPDRVDAGGGGGLARGTARRRGAHGGYCPGEADDGPPVPGLPGGASPVAGASPRRWGFQAVALLAVAGWLQVGAGPAARGMGRDGPLSVGRGGDRPSFAAREELARGARSPRPR